MSQDLSRIFAEWAYDPEDLVRIIQADDGREVMQVRQPLGIEQYEMDGRPDGLIPMGKESFLEILEENLAHFIVESRSDVGFNIDHEDFLNIQNEGILYYYRYLILFQIGDFERTVRDTEHNLRLCDLVDKYVENSQDKKELLQHKPYILRINAIAQAMLSLKKELNSTAASIIETAIEIIQNMPSIETPAFQFEKLRSIQSLKATLKQIKRRKSSPLIKLRNELSRAVDNEDYERAAELRDKIRAIQSERPQV